MQPPQKSHKSPKILRSYIRNLKVITEEKNQERERAKATPKTLRPKDSLENQILRWWKNLPEILRNRHYQISEIASQCSGRYRERPATREIAAALRLLGWTQHRDWTVGGRNRRLWKPYNKPKT